MGLAPKPPKEKAQGQDDRCHQKKIGPQGQTVAVRKGLIGEQPQEEDKGMEHALAQQKAPAPGGGGTGRFSIPQLKGGEAHRRSRQGPDGQHHAGDHGGEVVP